MPDFEALVRHQQTQRRAPSERLKVVEPITNVDNKTISDGKNLSSFFSGFIGGILGTIMLTGLALFLFSKGIIDIDLFL